MGERYLRQAGQALEESGNERGKDKMKAVLLALGWILLFLGGMAIGVGGFFITLDGSYILGPSMLAVWLVFGAFYVTTERFTRWPPSID